MASILHLLLGNNHSGNASFTTAQCELLLSLSSQRIDMQTEQQWTPIVGPLEHNIARFVSRGYLEESPLEDKFEAKYRVPDLKQMLEGRDIRIKGKKGEMIAALLGVIPQDEAATLVADVRLYRPTPAGRHRIESYLGLKEKAKADMESETFALLLKGDVRRAWSRIARYQTSLMFPDPLWTRGVPEPLLVEAAHLIRFSYDDLPLDEAHRKAAGAHLAMSVMLGESLADSGKRLACVHQRPVRLVAGTGLQPAEPVRQRYIVRRGAVAGVVCQDEDKGGAGRLRAEFAQVRPAGQRHQDIAGPLRGLQHLQRRQVPVRMVGDRSSAPAAPPDRVPVYLRRLALIMMQRGVRRQRRTPFEFF